MALSQLQKKILEKIEHEPELILKDMQSGTINTNSFKNEFFQDGKGLMHVGYDCYTKDRQKFKPLLTFLLKNTNLSIEDSKGRKNSVLEDVFNTLYHEKNKVNYDTIEDLYLLIKESKVNLQNTSINSALKYLSSYNKKDYFNEILENNNIVKDYNWNTIIENIIYQDDLPILKKVLKQVPELKKEICKIKAQSLSRGNYSIKECSNLLVLAVSCSDSIANYFLNEFNFDLSGKIEQSSQFNQFNYDGKISSPRVEAISTLAQAFLSNNFEIFIKIFEKINDRKLDYLNLPIISQSNSTKTLLKFICESDNKIFYEFIKNGIVSTYDSSNNNYNKKTFLKEITADLNISLDDKLFFSKELSNKIHEGEKFRKNNLLSGFFQSIYSKEISQKDTHTIGEIYNAVHKTNNTIANGENIFTVNLFNNSQLLNTLIANGLDVKQDTSLPENDKQINPMHWYFKLIEKLNVYELTKFYDNLNLKEFNKNLNTLKLLAPENKHEKFSGYNTLEYSLFKLDVNLFKNLTKNEINEFVKESNPLKTLTNPAEPLKDNYNKICNLLYENEINFFPDSNNSYFYKLLCFCDDHVLLDKILKNENKNIYELSKDSDFWSYITNPDVSQYVLDRGADYKNIEMTKKIIFSNNNVFSLYIENGGAVNYKDEANDNILHFLIKNNMWKKAEAVIKKHPHLTEEINNQNKLPISYMINDFNKECDKNSSKRPEHFTKSFTDSKSLFLTYLKEGKLNNNPKTKNILEEQFKKYTNIKLLIPEVDALILYKNIEATIPNEKLSVKVKKMKI